MFGVHTLHAYKSRAGCVCIYVCEWLGVGASGRRGGGGGGLLEPGPKLANAFNPFTAMHAALSLGK